MEFGEPLHKPEDDLDADDAIDVDLEAENLEADAPATEIEQTGQSSDLLKGGEDDAPADFEGWEPTLF